MYLPKLLSGSNTVKSSPRLVILSMRLLYSVAESSSTPSSAGPLSLSFFFMYSNRTMSTCSLQIVFTKSFRALVRCARRMMK